ncbi:MAG: hypothetical protein ABIJ09_01085 [Pseudomonadota bacterium]
MSRRLEAAVLCLVGSIACSQNRDDARDTRRVTMSETQQQVGSRFPILQALPGVAGRDPVPEGYHDAEQRFERASELVQADNHAEAAESYLKAAVALRVPADVPHAASLRACREIAYSNAWECFRAANQQSRGREKLQQAALEDRELAAMLRALVKTP